MKPKTNTVIESTYPITFRKEDARELGEYLADHASVVLTGMKRVGISNFLRFFLWHADIQSTYIKNGMTHVFVPVDLNDLIERDILPFWTLVLTRLVDVICNDDLFSEELRTKSKRRFRESIQIKDLFFTIDTVRKILIDVTTQNIHLTFFLIRFDRLASAVTPEFFSNLQGLRDAAKGQLSYVFTSFRPLSILAPNVFSKQNLAVFAHDMYMRPAQESDLLMILKTFQERYQMTLPATVTKWLIDISGGHVQYLQLALMRLREEKLLPKTREELMALLTTHEEILLQSEELFANLTKPEQEILVQIVAGRPATDKQKNTVPYLWDTGIIRNDTLFSPLLTAYIKTNRLNKPKAIEFTKKEHLLFSFLHAHNEELCERYDLVQAVWGAQEAEFGISDWAIDRLVARVRTKLRMQKSSYEIVTIVTRGYKLTKKS